jgi:hypothetical protein
VSASTPHRRRRSRGGSRQRNSCSSARVSPSSGASPRVASAAGEAQR